MRANCNLAVLLGACVAVSTVSVLVMTAHHPSCPRAAPPAPPPAPPTPPAPAACAASAPPPQLPPAGPVLHFVSHTHWDREWYLSAEALRGKLARLVRSVLDDAERAPYAYEFLLDGQALPLADWRAVAPARDRARLERALRCGRVSAGPWLVQPDEFLSSGECLVRNLLEGAREALALGAGSALRVGYLPDAFGHASQMPQLLRGFNITAAAFARGADSSAAGRFDATWTGPDGSSVQAAVLQGFYCAAGGTPETGTVSWLREKAAWGAGKAATRHVLLLNGCDHTGTDAWAHNVEAAAAELARHNITVVRSSLSKYLAAVAAESSAAGLQLPALRGELREGVQGLAGTLSARPRQKRLAWQATRVLEQWAEPLSSMLMAMAGASDPPHSLRERTELAWRLLLGSMPHDSAGGCVVDDVADDVRSRLKRSLELSAQVAYEAAVGVAALTEVPRRQLRGNMAYVTAFNPSPQRRSDIVVVDVDALPESVRPSSAGVDVSVVQVNTGIQVPARVLRVLGEGSDFVVPDHDFRKVTKSLRFRVALMADVPAVGYATYLLEFTPASSSPSPSPSPRAAEGARANSTGDVPVRMSNDAYALEFRGDGTVAVALRGADEAPLEMQLELTGDTGNTYVYGPTRPEPAPALRCHGVDSDPRLFSRVDCAFAFERVSGTALFVLPAGSAPVRVRVELSNDGRSNYRLQAAFRPRGWEYQSHFSDTPFDVVSRAAAEPSLPLWSFFGAASNASAAGFVVAARGMNEYSAAAGALGLTLMRAVDSTRDWADFDTPGAREPGDHAFEFAVVPWGGQLPLDKAILEARRFASPMAALQPLLGAVEVSQQSRMVFAVASELELIAKAAGERRRAVGWGARPMTEFLYGGPVPARPFASTGSLVETSPSVVVLSAVKQVSGGSRGGTVIVRVYNPTLFHVNAHVETPLLQWARASRCTVAEAECVALQTVASVNVPLPPKAIATIALEP
eukprot:m51a1_g14812 putative alpha-mannosidase (975) ;mRNA; f:601364-604488